MNSVAAPATATASASPAIGTESDLVRRAAKGDTESLGELLRRHRAPAWRLAQAVAADRDGAVAAFRDGFVKAVRQGRSGRRVGDEFRPAVLGGVYRAALDQSHDRSTAPAASRRPRAASADAALADAAFRSLPERWRAAVWLREVEHFDRDRIAAVLGVSAGVADQLVARGGRALAGRFAQARRPAPEQLGEVLRPLAVAEPANLEDVVTKRWSAGGAETSTLFAPLAAWFEDRAVRPMGVAVGTLVGLGLIALGVVPGGTTVRTQLGAGPTTRLPGSISVDTGSNTGAGSLATNGGAAGSLLATFPSGYGTGAGGNGAYLTGGLTAGGSASPAGGATGGTSSGAQGTTGGSSGSGSVGSPVPGGSAGTGGTGGGGGSGATGSGPPTVTVPGAGSVSTSPTGVLGTPTVSVNTDTGATVTINCNGTLVQATSCPAPTSTTTPPLTQVVDGVTGPVTSTVTTLPVVGGALGNTTQTLTTTITGITGGL